MSDKTSDDLSSAARRIADSPTLAVERAAVALGRSHGDVISLGAGEPDFATPAHVVEAARRACGERESHRYGAVGGAEWLREAIVAALERRSGMCFAPSQALVTNGAKQAVFTALAVLCGPGDDVLLPTPCWPTYVEAVKLAGARPVLVPSTPGSGFRVDPERLDAAWTPRARCLVINSPANPTGAVYAAAQAADLGAWAAARGCWLLTDEIYASLAYGVGGSAPSVPVCAPEIAERCVVVDGVSKAYAMTGWRVGWLLGPDRVVRAANRLQSHLTSNVNMVAQRAAAAALTGGQADAERMRAAYGRRRELVMAALDALPGVEYVTPEGAFYVFPSVETHLGRRIHGERIETTVDLARAILRHAHVVVVPGEAFGLPGHLRLSFAAADERLVEALDRLAAFLRAR